MSKLGTSLSKCEKISVLNLTISMRVTSLCFMRHGQTISSPPVLTVFSLLRAESVSIVLVVFLE